MAAPAPRKKRRGLNRAEAPAAEQAPAEEPKAPAKKTSARKKKD